MRILKKLLRKKNLQLQQFYNRFCEISALNDIQENTFSGNNAHCRHFQYNNLNLKANSQHDGCCLILDGASKA